jgi:hypothetical protein
MTSRQRLPNRRQCESFRFLHSGVEFTGSVGFYEDGRIAEVFTSCDRTTSPIESIARDAAIILSIGLQYGADLAVLRGALTRDDSDGPASVIGALLDAIAGLRKGEA